MSVWSSYVRIAMADVRTHANARMAMVSVHMRVGYVCTYARVRNVCAYVLTYVRVCRWL